MVTELCRKHGMSSATYYARKTKFGGLEVCDAKRLIFPCFVGHAVLGSGLIGHSQKMTVAASATAEKKAVGHRS